MIPTISNEATPVLPPAYHRAQARLRRALHIDALILVNILHLLMLCRLAVRLAHRRCPPPYLRVQGAPFAQRLLAWAVRLYQTRPRVIRLDAAYWCLFLIAWIHTVLGEVAVIPCNPKRQKNRSCLPPTWTKEKLS